jgi:chromosome segregation ATPase
MFMLKQDKDKLRQELDTMKRNIDFLRSDMRRELEDFKRRVDSLTHPHGAKKDGTPRAKPGRKPREQR